MDHSKRLAYFLLAHTSTRFGRRQCDLSEISKVICPCAYSLCLRCHPGCFFCNTRYRLPLAVGLIPFAVIGVERLWLFIKIRNWQTVALYITISAGFFLIEFLPVRATDDLSAYYNTHAIVLRSRGSMEEALQYLFRAIRTEVGNRIGLTSRITTIE